MTARERMTDEELAQIKERAEKATEGPWVWDDDYDMNVQDLPVLRGKEFNVMDFGNDTTFYPIAGNPPDDEDASFIAHARTDIPKLIAEVEYMREKQAELLEYNRQYFAEIKRLRAEIARLEMEAMK